MKISVFFLSLFLLLPLTLTAQHNATREDGRKVILHDDFTWSFADSGKPKAKPKPRIANTHLEIPSLKPDEEIITHTSYSLVYAEKYEQA